MGKYDSSKYRVEPFVDWIKKSRDLIKFNNLLQLVGISCNSFPKEFYYGYNEKKLKPKKEFLVNLLKYIALDRDNSFINETNIKNEKRKILYFGSNIEKEKTLNEGLTSIEECYSILSPGFRKWFIFEGYTHPDIFLEGDDYIILCEGKWTERNITSHTYHLSNSRGEYRNQLIRHIEATLNYTDENSIKKKAECPICNRFFSYIPNDFI